MPKAKQKWTLVFAGALIAMGAGGLGLAWKIHNGQPKSAPTVVSSLDDTAPPSSDKPSSDTIASYQVADSHPKYIAVGNIGVNKSRVIQLGLSSKGRIVAPDNIYDAGWFNRSSKPGRSGAMFIYGHVSNWHGDALFHNLKKIKAGDAITITSGDNKVFTYKVTKTKIYPYDKVDMAEVLSAVDSNKPGLNLMTCSGQVITGTREFNQRLVVFSSLTED